LPWLTICLLAQLGMNACSDCALDSLVNFLLRFPLVFGFQFRSPCSLDNPPQSECISDSGIPDNYIWGIFRQWPSGNRHSLLLINSNDIST